MAGVPINDGNEVRSPRYLDLRQGKITAGRSVPYNNANEALAAIPDSRKAEGLPFFVKNGDKVETWRLAKDEFDAWIVVKDDGGGENFANADLVATGNREHAGGGNQLTFTDFSKIAFTRKTVEQTIPFDAQMDLFLNASSYGALFRPRLDFSEDNLTVAVDVDGVVSDFVFTRMETPQGTILTHDFIPGTAVTPVSYTGMIKAPMDFILDLPAPFPSEESGQIPYALTTLNLTSDKKLEQKHTPLPFFGKNDTWDPSYRFFKISEDADADFKTYILLSDLGADIVCAADGGGSPWGINVGRTEASFYKNGKGGLSFSDLDFYMRHVFQGDPNNLTQVTLLAQGDTEPTLRLRAGYNNRESEIIVREQDISLNNRFTTLTLFFERLPIATDNTDALSKNLTVDQVYKTATGELRIVV